MIGQCFSIAQDKMRSRWEADADLVLEPQVGEFAYDSFARAPEMIRIGAETVRAALPQIKSWFPTAPDLSMVVAEAERQRKPSIVSAINSSPLHAK